MKVLRFAIGARWIDDMVYVRKIDLLKWLDDEAEANREEGRLEAAEVIESISRSLRKVRAS